MNLPDQSKLHQTLSGLFKHALILLAFCANPALASPNGIQTLSSLFELARQRDPAYLAAASQLKADLENENQAFAVLLPQVNLGARIEKQENTYNAFGGSVSTSRDPGTYTLSLNQALFRPQAWESYKQSQLGGEIARLTFQQAEQDLILRLSRAYFDTLAAQDELENLKEQKAAIAEQLAFAKANFDVGNATVTDQQEAKARLDLVSARELAAKNRRAITQLQLESIVGMPIRRLANLQTDLRLTPPLPDSVNMWTDRAKVGNSQMQQARLAQQIAKSEVKQAEYGHLPTLDLTAQVVKTEQQIFDGNTGQPFDLGVDNSSIGLNLNVPIFSGGGTQSKVRQQAALLEKARHNLAMVSKNVRQATKTAFLGVQTSLAQVRALETAVASSKLSLQSNKTAYEVGIRINLDVINAQQQLNAVQLDLNKARYTSLINMLELQAVTGQLNARALQDISALLVK